MHIGIVLHPFGDSSKGLEQYIYEATCSILRESKDEVSFTVFVKGNPNTSGLPTGVRVVNLPSTFFWNLALVPWYKKCDAFVFFTESAPLFLWKKSIIVFFDAAYYYFGSQTLSGRIQRKIFVWWRGLMMRCARHVVAISEASKHDLVEKFSVPSQQVSVIYPGFKTFDTTENTLIPSPSEPFFMYVGPLKERKNPLRIVEAYIAFREKTQFKHQMFLVGRKTNGEYESALYARVKESVFADSIFFKTDVDDASLQALYKTTTALVYPSLLEGFGLPILEALSCKAFVITSSTTSTKEVLGSAGRLVNPYHVEEIADAMVQVAEVAYDKEQFKKEAKAQCDLFSWEKSGQEWEQFFQSGAIQKPS